MNRFEEAAKEMGRLDKVIVRDFSNTQYGEKAGADPEMPETLVRELLYATAYKLNGFLTFTEEEEEE